MLQPEDSMPIPEMTRLVAKAAFPQGSLAIVNGTLELAHPPFR